jgi:hypothetical protein
VRRENTKKLTKEETTATKLAELRRKALTSSDIDRFLSLLIFSKLEKGIAH